MQELFEKIIEKMKADAERWEGSGKEYNDKCEIAVGRGLRNAIEIVKQEAAEYNNGWIPCSGCSDCQHNECEHCGKV